MEYNFGASDETADVKEKSENPSPSSQELDMAWLSIIGLALFCCSLPLIRIKQFGLLLPETFSFQRHSLLFFAMARRR